MFASGASLTLGTNAINFPSADPDTTPSIPASQNPVTVTCRVTGAFLSNVTLKVQAGGNLVSGGNSIPINQVTWTVTGSGYTTRNHEQHNVGAGRKLGAIHWCTKKF